MSKFGKKLFEITRLSLIFKKKLSKNTRNTKNFSFSEKNTRFIPDFSGIIFIFKLSPRGKTRLPWVCFRLKSKDPFKGLFQPQECPCLRVRPNLKSVPAERCVSASKMSPSKSLSQAQS